MENRIFIVLSQVDMNRQSLIAEIYKKKSFLCVGLDTDFDKIPQHLKHFEDPVFEFNKQIIDHTADLCVSFKLNTAFYEARGIEGWKSLKKTLDYIPKSHFSIADAKRGDIGNTSNMYAKAFFENMDFDSITVAPYMGSDSVRPFLNHNGKWVILLALTSNQGSSDFQYLPSEGQEIYKKVIRKSSQWADSDKMMYVVGATHPEDLGHIRQLIPNHFLLVPGVGAQGGSLEAVAEYGFVKDECGLLVNSSRGIIYAGGDSLDFAQASREAAKKLQKQMSRFF